MGRFRAGALAASVVAFGGGVAGAAVPRQADTGAITGSRGVQLISQAPGGGPASEPVVSQDSRTARYVAWTSQAGGGRNVYLATRARPYSTNGSPWALGSVRLMSAGSGGAAANGDSYGPQINGDDLAGATCLAFVSEASNLISGDRDGHADAFVRKLPSGKLRRVAGHGAVRQVAVDRRCEHLLYRTASGVYRRTLSGGATTRMVRGSVDDFAVDDQGRSLVYTRGGQIRCSTDGRRFRSLGAGTQPAVSGSGKVFAFERGGTIYRSERCGRPSAIHAGSDPALTLSGHYVVYADGTGVWTTFINHVLATCPAPPSAPSPSGHGNYVGFVCADAAGVPQVYLVYIGPK